MNDKLDKFIVESDAKHSGVYDYSKFVYKNSDTKSIIICPIHGEFNQSPDKHKNSGQGCPKCAGKGMDTEEFIRRSILKHGSRYEYSSSKYTKSIVKVIIKCKEHGEFNQRPNDHLSGKGCPICARIKTINSFRIPLSDAIERCRVVHNNKYDYSLVVYNKIIDKVDIICPIHGKFKQSLNCHMNSGDGCPTCNSSKGEIMIKRFLESNDINYESEKKFDGCVGINHLRFDFYIPKLNMAIEYDGIQHFKPVEHFGGLSFYERTVNNDREKARYCRDNSISLLRIPYTKYNEISKILNREIFYNDITIEN